MTSRDLLLSLLTGALAAVVGRTFMSLPTETQKRWRPALFTVCGIAFAVGIAIMVIGVLGGFDS